MKKIEKKSKRALMVMFAAKMRSTDMILLINWYTDKKIRRGLMPSNALHANRTELTNSPYWYSYNSYCTI